jgi:hypothetical protein
MPDNGAVPLDLSAELQADVRNGYSPVAQAENALTTASKEENYLAKYAPANTLQGAPGLDVVGNTVAGVQSAASVPGNVTRGAVKGVASQGLDILSLIQRFTGGWEEIAKTAQDMGIPMDAGTIENLIGGMAQANVAPDPDSTVQQIVHPIAKYLSTFVPVAGGVGAAARAGGYASKLGKMGASTAITDFMQNPNSGSTVDALEAVVGWFNPEADPAILEFLKSRKDKPELVNRLNAAFTGATVGLTFDAALQSLRFLRGQMQATIAKRRIERAAQKGRTSMEEVQRTVKHVTERDPSESALQYSQRVRSNARVDRINETFARWGVDPIGYETGTARDAPRSSRQREGSKLPMGNRGLKDAKEAAMEKTVIDEMIAGEPVIAHEMVALIRELMESGKGNIKPADMKRLAAGSKTQSQTVTLYRGGNPEKGHFWAENESTARTFAGDGGELTKRRFKFGSVLEARNWQEAKQKLGLPQSATMSELVEAVQKSQYDAVSYSGAFGGVKNREYIVNQNRVK